jgi:hypothetical protein
MGRFLLIKEKKLRWDGRGRKGVMGKNGNQVSKKLYVEYAEIFI